MERRVWLQSNGVDARIPVKLKSYTAVPCMAGARHRLQLRGQFHDGIDTETYGNPDGSAADGGPYYPPRKYWNVRPVAIDYYNNYMTNFHDNALRLMAQCTIFA